MTDIDAPARVPDLIRARTEAAPDAVALRTGTDEITYAELWRRAHEAGQELSAVDVGAGDIVAVQLPPCPDAIISMLATWLAGAAFLPMDAAVPDDYRSRLLHDSGAAAVVDRKGLTALETARTGAAAQRPPAAPADRPAYVIYTSGSTGSPKGVLVGHRALAGHVTAIAGVLGLNRDETVLQFASLGFDVAQEEIWPTLATGGTLALRSAGTVDAVGLAAYARDLGVSVLQLPTAYWRLVCADLQGSADPSFARVRAVVIGGESATANDVHVHRNGPLRHCTLINGYGPTETVITATALVLPPDHPVPASTGLPIGVPVGERLVYVLGPDQRPVAHDVPGELWIGGPLLADGYLRDPVRTTDRFRPDPFARNADARMYRTGDLVVRHRNGELEFLGRRDNQVKVRGHRIELDEIDRHLLDTPGITAAASITLDDATGGHLLGAGISRVPGGPAPAEIRDRLRHHLPEHMVPGPIFVFDSLPLTASGKIDRRAVASLAEAEHAAVPSAGPRPVKRQAPFADQLVALLRDLLRVPTFGPDDDFIAHGGDSLMALRVSGTMRARGWELRPSELLIERTPRRAAERVAALRR
jgi:amino acid adenylation domain-containing protein